MDKERNISVIQDLDGRKIVIIHISDSEENVT